MVEARAGIGSQCAVIAVGNENIPVILNREFTPQGREGEERPARFDGLPEPQIRQHA